AHAPAILALVQHDARIEQRAEGRHAQRVSQGAREDQRGHRIRQRAFMTEHMIPWTKYMYFSNDTIISSTDLENYHSSCSCAAEQMGRNAMGRPPGSKNRGPEDLLRQARSLQRLAREKLTKQETRLRSEKTKIDK